jgi:Cu/Ag efflux pump CusA
MWITLASGADYDRAKAAIQSVLHGYPGLSTHLGTYPSDRIAQVASSQNDDLVVRVFGSDFGTLQKKANDVRAMLARVPGVASPVVRAIPTQPTADIRVNLDAAQRYGLRPGDVRRDATTLTSGLIVGNLYEQSKIFDVVVWGAQSTRSDLTELGNLLIDTPSGRQVALKDVATVAVAPEPTAITHDGVERDIEVAAKVTGDPGTVVAAVRARLAAMAMPYEYHAEVSGNATVERADLTRTLAYGAAAVIGLLLLLQAAAGSWRRAGLMLASLPLSVTGGVLIAPVVGGVWNAGSLAGLFAVFALAVRSSILLGRRIPDEAQGGRAAVLDAARDRAAPLLQSALVTAAVLLPAAAFGAGAGLEILQPLAVTVLGGLASLVTVQGYVLPALLASTERQPGERPEAARPEREPVRQTPPVTEPAAD